MKVLFLVPAPLNISPGQRFRFEHYLPLLKKDEITYTLQSFWALRTWNILFNQGHLLSKTLGLALGFVKRFFILFTLYKYEYVFIYREAAPIGPPVFEWIIAKICKKKIIYDFDDAIWVRMSSSANPWSAAVKCTWKVKHICKYSSTVSAGNSFLAAYAIKYTKDVRVIPTVVDTERVHNKLKNQDDKPLTVGWTGTFTNFYNLESLSNIVSTLKKKYDFEYLIISDKNPQLTGVDYVYKRWNFTTEIEDLLCMNIGIMPLRNTEVELGKCGFKAIQYMSLGIPAVVSPVGANCDVVKDGNNGFWASSHEDWYNKLEQVIIHRGLRVKLGIAAQSFIKENYSVQATAGSFLNLFSFTT